MKLNYIVIPLIAAGVSAVGGSFTSSGMDWYRAINLPPWTPPGSIIGVIWTVIYILTAASAIIVWNTWPRPAAFRAIIALFAVNAFLNATWSFVFFARGMISAAFVHALALEATVIALLLLIRPISKTAALLLAPYAAWTAFASFLTLTIARLNAA